MGLVYEVFFVKMQCNEFAKLLKEEKITVDETPFYSNDFEDQQKTIKFLEDWWKKKIDGNKEEFNKIANHEISEEMQDYRKRCKNHLQIYISPVPKHPEWTFGSYFHCASLLGNAMGDIPSKIFGFYVTTFLKYVPIVWFVDYHHGCNDGDINSYSYNEDHKIELRTIEHNEDEAEQYEKFIERVQKQYDTPFADFHNYMSDFKRSQTKWKYHLIFNLERNKNGEKESSV